VPPLEQQERVSRALNALHHRVESEKTKAQTLAEAKSALGELLLSGRVAVRTTPGPLILNFSTGGTGPMEGRVAHIAKVKPPLGALNMGSMNYAKYSPRRKEFVFDFVFENPFRDIAYLLAVMKEAGVKPELECFDIGHTNSVWPLLDQGLLKRPLQFSFIMGVLGGIRASAENLAMQAREAPEGSTWEVIGISPEQWRMIGSALALGGNVRVGLEDNFYLDAAGSKMARSNGELVEKAVRMARDIGREPATVEQARRLLTLDAPW